MGMLVLIVSGRGFRRKGINDGGEEGGGMLSI